MFKDCNTKEEVMVKVIKEGQHLEASKRFLELGFTNEAIQFYLLSQQEDLLSDFKQQVSSIEVTSHSNQVAGQLMLEASENNKRSAQSMFEASSIFLQGSQNMGSRY